MKTDSVSFCVPSTMTDLNLIIFFLDYTLICLLFGETYIIELKKTLTKRVRKIVCRCSRISMFKITWNAEYIVTHQKTRQKLCKTKRFIAVFLQFHMR
jgi:hypothetical protein